VSLTLLSSYFTDHTSGFCLRKSMFIFSSKRLHSRIGSDHDRNDSQSIGKLVVLLPSEHARGEFVISNSNPPDMEPKHFTFSSESTALSTVVLAWHNNTTPEMKPITSGDRLILYYDILLKLSAPYPQDPADDVPDVSAPIQRTREVLRKWCKGKYKSNINMALYPLEHRYDAEELSTSCLKGSDARRVAQLKDIANQCGYVMLLGTLKFEMRGVAACGPDYDEFERREWKQGDLGMSPKDNLYMDGEVEDVVDLAGHSVIGECSLRVRYANVIPKNAFSTVSPDECRYGGWQGYVSIHILFVLKLVLMMSTVITGPRQFGLLFVDFYRKAVF
jgi:hypothetical protein